MRGTAAELGAPRTRRREAAAPTGRSRRRRAGHRGDRARGHRPRAAGPAGPAPGAAGGHGRAALPAPGRRLRRGRARLPAGPRGRRLPLPEPSRPGRRTWSASCWRASRPASRPRPSRRWPSWPTSSRSPGPRWRRSGASTPTPCCARCRAEATSTRSGGIPGRARPCSGGRRRSSWSAWASTPWPTCRRSPTSCPAPTSSRRWRPGSASSRS